MDKKFLRRDLGQKLIQAGCYEGGLKWWVLINEHILHVGILVVSSNPSAARQY